MAISEEENEESAENSLEEKTQRAAKQAVRQLVIGLVLTPLLLALFAVGLINLVNFHQATTELAMKEPENLILVFGARIETAREDAEKQYAEYLDKMSSDEMVGVSNTFVTLYDVSERSENDYALMVSTYQQLAYESASRVQGSGEWYFYYKEKISKLNESAEQRNTALTAYFASE